MFIRYIPHCAGLSQISNIEDCFCIVHGCQYILLVIIILYYINKLE